MTIQMCCERSNAISALIDPNSGTLRMAFTGYSGATNAAAGVHIARIEIDKAGKIAIITTDVAEPSERTEVNEWDRV